VPVEAFASRVSDEGVESFTDRHILLRADRATDHRRGERRRSAKLPVGTPTTPDLTIRFEGTLALAA